MHLQCDRLGPRVLPVSGLPRLQTRLRRTLANQLWPSLFDRLWPIRLWPNRVEGGVRRKVVQRSPNQQQHHNNNNHTRKFGQNTKTLKLAKVGLAKVGQDHVGQSRFGQSRNSQSPSSLDFLHFQHLCCVHHMEAPAGMICSSPQSFASSFSVPCCRQRIHFECLARSVPFLRRLPFLHTGLRPHHLLAAFEHLDIPIDFNAPPVNSLYSLQTAGSDPLRRTVHKRRLLTGDIFYWQWKVVNFISSKVVRLYIITSDNWKKLVLIIDLKPKDHFTTRRRELQLKHLPG